MNSTEQLDAELRQVVAEGFLPDETGMHLVRRDCTPPCAEYDAAARQVERQAQEAGQALADYWQALRINTTEAT
jgi:hypothetical protein